VLEKIRNKEATLRGFKFIEYNQYFRGCRNKGDKEDLEVIKKYQDSVFTVKHDNPYFTLKLNDYVKKKPFEEQIKKEIDLLRGEIFKIAETGLS